MSESRQLINNCFEQVTNKWEENSSVLAMAWNGAVQHLGALLNTVCIWFTNPLDLLKNQLIETKATPFWSELSELIDPSDDIWDTMWLSAAEKFQFGTKASSELVSQSTLELTEVIFWYSIMNCLLWVGGVPRVRDDDLTLGVKAWVRGEVRTSSTIRKETAGKSEDMWKRRRNSRPVVLNESKSSKDNKLEAKITYSWICCTCNNTLVKIHIQTMTTRNQPTATLYSGGGISILAC